MKISRVCIVLGSLAAAGVAAAETQTPIENRISLSCGAPNRGSLHGAWTLPENGLGYQIPQPWLERERHYGTRELIWLIKDVARTVADAHPGATLGVADMSERSGGRISGHRSHQSGRDVDFIYYASTASGAPLPPPEYMPYYGWRTRATSAKAPTWRKRIPSVYFDKARNWALVKALATHPDINVEHIFVGHPIRRWLLDYAKKSGESPEVIARVKDVLHFASRAGSKHLDHMHVRIGCSMDDKLLGECREAGRRSRHAFVCPVEAPLAAKN